MSEPAKLFYTISELAEMTGISAPRVRRLLAGNGVETVTASDKSHKRLVPVAALARELPDVLDGIRSFRRR